MKVYINREVVLGPWGGGNNWIRAFHEFVPRDGVELVQKGSLNILPDVIVLAGIDNDNRGGISAEQAFMYKLYANPACKIVLRVNENDARKGTKGVDDLLLKVSKHIDGTVFVSRWLQDYFNQKGWACPNQTVIINGVQCTIFKPQPKLNNGKTNLLMSHWSDNYMKGQDYAERLDEFVGKHSDAFTFTFVGRTQAALKHSKHVKPLHGKELGEELGKYDVCINASRFDPGPNSVIEPITCGLPTYVHKDGGGAVEFAGIDHVFDDWDQLQKLLLTGRFVPNSTSFNPWNSCIDEYVSYLQQV